MTRPYLVKIYNEYKQCWVKLPMPNSNNATTSTLVNAGRNAKGELMGNVIRSGFAKLEMTIPYMTVAQYSTFLKLFEPYDMYRVPTTDIRGSFINLVGYFDQVTGTYGYRNMYVSDRKAGMMQYKMVNGTPTPYGWSNIDIHLIDTGKLPTGILQGATYYIAEDGTLKTE